MSLGVQYSNKLRDYWLESAPSKKIRLILSTKWQLDTLIYDERDYIMGSVFALVRIYAKKNWYFGQCFNVNNEINIVLISAWSFARKVSHYFTNRTKAMCRLTIVQSQFDTIIKYHEKERHPSFNSTSSITVGANFKL